MDGYRKSSHTVYDIKYYVIWVTKYRHKVLCSPVAIRTRKFIRQGCEARGTTILLGSVGKIKFTCYSPDRQFSLSIIMRYLKGRLSRLLQDEFPELKNRFWGQHLWVRGSFCTTVTEEIDYSALKHKSFEKDFSLHKDFSRRHIRQNPPALADGCVIWYP